MSRQIRRQIPQKQKKKRVDRNACLLVFILIFSGILTFLLLTARDNSKLNSTLDETFDFVKNRIESYEIYNTNDQVKSLVRLLDKTTELSSHRTGRKSQYRNAGRICQGTAPDRNPCTGSESEGDRTECKRWRYYVAVAEADQK